MRRRPTRAQAKAKEKVKLEALHGYIAANSYSHSFYSKENKKLIEGYTKRSFIVQRTMDLGTFRLIAMKKIVHNRKWLKTISNIRRFVPRIVYEFYANMSGQINTKSHPYFCKIYFRGYVYDFSSKVINDFFQAPSFDFDDFQKD